MTSLNDILPSRPSPPMLCLMTLENFHAMDPHLLAGLVNTELRNQADDLDDLCRTHDIPQVELVAKLAEAGYAYLEATRQFR